MVTTTSTHTLGRFIWRELFTRDRAAAKKFYGELFGWTFNDVPRGTDGVYTIVTSGGLEIAGMLDVADVPGENSQIPPHWGVYVSVDDVDKRAKLAVSEGGTLISEGYEIPGVGRVASILDPQGAVIHLLRLSAGDPPDTQPPLHEFCWETLMANDRDSAAAYYTKVLDWNTKTSAKDDFIVFTRRSGAKSVGVGDVDKLPQGSHPAWIPYVRVRSINATFGKVKELGGRVLTERTELPEVGAYGFIEDPTGAALFLYETK